MVNFKNINIALFFLSFSFCSANISFPGFDIFTSVERLSLGGAGFLNASSLSSLVNPSVYSGKYFSASVIRYPASITNQSAAMVLPFKSGYGHLLISNTSYGIFQGYSDDAEPTGNYSSNDNKVVGSCSYPIYQTPVKLGCSVSFFNSNYGKYNFKILSLSFGGHWHIQKLNAAVGMSIHQLGFSFGSANVDLLNTFTISLSKKLRHLPSKTYIDITKNRTQIEIFTGIETNVASKVKILLGTSTRKIEHNTNEDLFKTVTGASGFGLQYSDGSFSIHYGLFMHGTGSTNTGLEIKILV